MKKYSFNDHPEHEARLKEWRDKAIATVLDTTPLSKTDEVGLKAAIKGLYEAADLVAPDDTHIVIVDSPFIARFVAGFASALWYKKHNNSLGFSAIGDATRAAVDDRTAAHVTWAAACVAVDVATVDATHAATRAATWDVVDVATVDATHAVKWDVERAATWDVVDSVTRDATRAATLTYVFNTNSMKNLSYMLGLSDFGMQCVREVHSMVDHGNFSYGWVSHLSFFRDVAKLPLDYSKFNHYETAARLGSVRYMHKNFCIVSRKPLYIKRDNLGRPHCLDAPYIMWADGSGIYAIHGVRVPAWIVTNPELITVEKINTEQNQEVKTAMLFRYGIGRYLKDSGARTIHNDLDSLGLPRYLYEMKFNDKKIKTVQVYNSTVEPDGSRNIYFINVHPELRPMYANGGLGEPQKDTCHNAIASTFGKRGEQYNLDIET